RIFILVSFSSYTQAQNVKIKVKDKQNLPLPGAEIYTVSSKNKISVISNENGNAELNQPNMKDYIYCRLLGYRPDSIAYNSENTIEFTLDMDSQTLREVEVKGSGLVLDRLNPIFTEIINAQALKKAACCNLSESFETNSSISVSNADGITGSKQIQLLGLNGTYIQSMYENIPLIRGAALPFGYSSLPGTWIQSIDIAKGTGSVVTGFENMVGGIHVELKKPDQSERKLVNVYMSSLGRAELNFNQSKRRDKGWSRVFLSHISGLATEVDRNNDQFLDSPKYLQINLMERWKYVSETRSIQLGVRTYFENRLGGSVGFKSTDQTPGLYGFTNTSFRPEFFLKAAKLFPNDPLKGLGLIFHSAYHVSDTKFGYRPHSVNQWSNYLNLIYQNYISNSFHTYKTGLSFQNDNFDETYLNVDRDVKEFIPGIFGEYTYNKQGKTILGMGLRLDYHNLYKLQVSPRIHIKQDLNKEQSIRVSAGKGWRVPRPFLENFGSLVSNRGVKFIGDIRPERGWTYGAAYLLDKNQFKLSAEFFQTRFQDQLIVDSEHQSLLYFYNLDGISKTNSAMVEVFFKLWHRIDLKAAYRNTNTLQTMGTPYGEKQNLQRMLIPRDRILINAAYALPFDKWKLDATYQFNSRIRIMDPNQEREHVSYSSIINTYAPNFGILNAQVSRNFTNFEWYLGGENILGYTQKDPIFGSDDPFGTQFDAGMVWGPIFGANVYLGVRYSLK
ncbi:MAG: TonB-dependent receptor plug domain-containing protein, partial [Leadbetterella sp.]